MGGFTVRLDREGAVRQAREMGQRFRFSEALLWEVVDEDGRVVSSWNTESQAREIAARENGELTHRGEERIRRLQTLRDEVMKRLGEMGPEDLGRDAAIVEESARLLGIKGWAVFS